jgi:hypothetical protein
MSIPSRAAYQVTSDTDPPRYAPGCWYTTLPVVAAAASASSANALRAYPWVVRSRVRIQALGARVTTGAAGLAQLAIYRANSATLNPMGIPLANTGDIDVSGTGNVNGALVQGIVTINPGLHYFAYWTNIGVTWQGSPLSYTPAAVIFGGPSQTVIAAAATTSAVLKSAGATYGSAWPNADQLTWAEAGSSQTFLGQFQVAT